MTEEDRQGLPEGWAAAELLRVVAAERPRKLPTDCVDLPYVGMEQIEAHSRSLLGTLPASQFKSSAFHFQKGDVLYGRLRPYLNKVWCAEFEGLCSAEFIVLTASGAIVPEYLSLYLNGDEFLDFASNLDRGDRPRISFDQIASYRIPLPPLAEQRRIVAKVESLLARVQVVRQRLARVPGIVKRFRQSILNAAYSGRLTIDWQLANPGAETATQLIERLRNEGFQPSEFPAQQWRSSQRIPVIEVDLPAIPPSWEWIRLPEAGYMNRGRSRHRPRNAAHLYGGDYPFVQTGDIARSQGRIVTHAQTYSDAGLAQSRLWPEDTVCITIAANIANSALLTYPSCFPDSVVGIVTDRSLCVPQYLEYFIRTARENLAEFAPATAQKNINIAILNEVSVPLPPLAEQHEIVRRVDALFALADAIERRVAAASARADRLTQAILAKAFRGELVPTEAELARAEGRDYETAEQLLERIRSEQGDAPRRKQAKRSRKTASS